MAWYSALALYLLVWVLVFFMVLPIGVRTSAEEGAPLVPGQAPSAPHRPMLGRKLLWTTAISALLAGLYILNWELEWVRREQFLALFPSF